MTDEWISRTAATHDHGATIDAINATETRQRITKFRQSAEEDRSGRRKDAGAWISMPLSRTLLPTVYTRLMGSPTMPPQAASGAQWGGCLRIGGAARG